jgi:Arc/MetJ-type ribon-helix-helix transcriptional regulator
MKKPISATIDKKLVDWISSQLKDNLKYRNKSHVIEVAIRLLKKEEENKR